MTNPRVPPFVIACCLTILLTAAPIAFVPKASPPAQPALANRLPAFPGRGAGQCGAVVGVAGAGDALSLFKTVIGPQLGLTMPR